jgi:hypothetical protein
MAMETPYLSLDEMLARGDRLVKLRFASELIGRHPDTLKRKMKRGEISLVKTSARTYDVWLSELRRYVKEREARS